MVTDPKTHPYYETAANKTTLLLVRKHLPADMQLTLTEGILHDLLDAYDAGKRDATVHAVLDDDTKVFMAAAEKVRSEAAPPQCFCGCGGTAGCKKLPMNDPAVKEVLADLERLVMQQDIDVLQRSLRMRRLDQRWIERVSGAPSSWHPWPPVGKPWGGWLYVLGGFHRPITLIARMLADAGVLGTAWSEEARKRVWEEKGWK